MYGDDLCFIGIEVLKFNGFMPFGFIEFLGGIINAPTI